jgi:hypothetical protein
VALVVEKDGGCVRSFGGWVSDIVEPCECLKAFEASSFYIFGSVCVYKSASCLKAGGLVWVVQRS